jgi:S1-C subfamily serine protease
MKTIRRSKLWIVVVIVAMSLTACSIPGVITQILPSISGQSTETNAPSTTNSQSAPSAPASQSFVIPDEMMQQDALVSLYQNVSPGVVSIQVFTDAGSALGSGFVVDKQGNIVTNYHVVDGANTIEVNFQNGLKVYGEVVGQDLDSDLAVVKVDVPADELVPLTIGDSNQAAVGRTVVAIGNPYGLSSTMTVGIVSARGRTLESIRQTAEGAYFSAGDLIQTDATINPGNSGGPLLNLDGEVIGVNRAIQTSGTTITGQAANSGIGFAVSSNILNLVLPSLINGETYPYPYLGLSAIPQISLTEADLLGLSEADGAYVVQIVPGGPADQAGIKAGDQPTQIQGLFGGGDLIVSVDGHQVLQFSDMLSYMMLNKHPGDQMVVTVLRGDQTLDLTVTLGERPENGQ